MQPFESQFRSVPISSVNESPFNHRRRFNEAALNELAETIAAKGILQPLLVRRNPMVPNMWQIIFGERRFRAAHIAQLQEVPVRVAEMTDAEVIEVQAIENVQRVDVHLYEEAEGLRNLLKLPGYDVTAVAGKIGKSESYVRSRLKLLDLVPEVADAFLGDRITFAHARLIAPLPKEKQPEALKACFARYTIKETLLPVFDLREWIHDDDGDDLADAKFALDDAQLVPAAGSCITCPKSSCAAGKLFGDDNGGEVCYDSKCFDAKTEAHIQSKAKAGLVAISTAWDAKQNPPGALNRQEYIEIEIPEPKAAPPSLDPEADEDDFEDEVEPGEKPCEFMEDAIIAAGHDRGAVTKICRNLKCPIHGSEADEKRALAGRQEGVNQNIEDWRKKQKESERKKKAAMEKRRKLYDTIVGKWAPTMDRSVFFLLVVHLLDQVHHKELLENIAADLGIAKQKDISAQRAVIYTWAEKAGALQLRAAFIQLLFVEHIEREERDRNYDLLEIASDTLKDDLTDQRAAAPKAPAKKAPAKKAAKK